MKNSVKQTEPKQVESIPMYLTMEEVAKRFNISTRHLRRMIESGRFLGSIKFGRIHRWSVSALEQWEADGCKPITK